MLIGIDIGGTKISIVLGTLEGEILKQVKFPTPRVLSQALEQIFSSVDDLISTSSGQDIQAIGVSCGGPLDSRNGVILSPPNLPGWDEVEICRLLNMRTNRPCYLENDANACALAEWLWGAGVGCCNMVFLTFGTGLGAGLILDGRLYEGVSGMAGEVGHIRLAGNGPVGYGKAGSWEGYCSGAGISRLYKQLYGVCKDTKEICRLAGDGDGPALDVINRSARFLGLGISMLLDILNPELIVIGSVYARQEELFFNEMTGMVTQEALAINARDCRIVPSGLGETLGDTAALGVAINGLRVDQSAREMI